MCLPKDTSSLVGPFLTPRGLLVATGDRPRTGVLLHQAPAEGLVLLSDTPPPPLPGDLRIIFILLRSLNPSTEEEGEEG